MTVHVLSSQINRRSLLGVFATSIMLAVGAVDAGNAYAMLSPTPMTKQPQLNTGGYINDIEVVGDTAYIGGLFTTVGGQARSNLAAFDLKTGGVLPWNPGANSDVKALDVSGSDIYVAGSFTTVGTNSVKRRSAAKIDSSGAATSWNPGPDSGLNDIAVGNDVAYMGGKDFTSVGRCSGSAGGALSTATGSICDQGLPSVTGGGGSSIDAVAPDGSGGWYIGGTFTTVGGLARNKLAHILANKTVDTSWDPGAGGLINGINTVAVSPDGNTVYVGGNFSFIGTQWRNHIAAICGVLNCDGAATEAGKATAWNPSANNEVQSLVFSPISDITIYVGGNFTSIGGASRNRIAALNASDGLATAWDPNASSTVMTMAVSPDGGTVYAGGSFMGVNCNPTCTTRNRIAALDSTTGVATAWDPNADNAPSSIAVSPDGSTVYAGGSFTGVNCNPICTTRNRIAALSSTTGAATAWNPNANGNIIEIAVSPDGSTVYAGGSFTGVNCDPTCTTRNNIAALSSTTGLATAWDPNADSGVNAVAVSGSNVYAGGLFNSIGGASRNRIAAVDNTTGGATAWNPSANGAVDDLEISPDGNTVYAGGSFSTIGGQTRNRIAALNNTTGLATAWDPNANEMVNDIEISSDGLTIYTGGVFTGIGGQTRNRLAALSSTSGNASDWNPNLDNTVNSIAVTGNNKVFVAGSFYTIGEDIRYKLAQFDSSGDLTSWNSAPNEAPAALATWGDSVVVGASGGPLPAPPPFTTFGFGLDAVMRKGLAVFNDVSAPVNKVLPSISGDPAPKENLTCGTGTWSSDAAVTYSYRWMRDGQTIGQAKDSTYTVYSDDAGSQMSCVVTATNFAGSTEATSASVTVADDDTTTDSTSCKTRGEIVSKSLREVLANNKIRVRVSTNQIGSTANLHLRADGVRAKLAAQQNVTFSNSQTTDVSLKLKPMARQQLRRRASRRERSGQKKVAMELRVYCFYGGKKTRTSKSQSMSVSGKSKLKKKSRRK